MCGGYFQASTFLPLFAHFPAFYVQSMLISLSLNVIFPCINSHFPTQEFSTPRPRRLYATPVAYIRHARGVYTPRPWRREYFPHNIFIVNTVILICML